MKKVVLLLTFILILTYSYGQPAPCQSESLDIIENVQKIDFDKTDFSFVDIQLKRDSNNYRWSDILKNDSIVTDKLILEHSSYRYCSNIRYKSNRNGRFYFTGNTPNNILIIQSGMQKMYIVFPYQDRIENEYFFGIIVDSINKLNIQKGKKAFYNPNMYISNIEFKEGIFFIKDYDKMFGIKSFDKNEITEFFPDNDVYDHRNPKDYWSNKVSFISMFDEKKGPEYSKVILGSFMENQAIEIILKNHPKIIRSILESSTDGIVVKKDRTDHQEHFFKIWYELLRKHLIDKENELLQKVNARQISIEEAYLFNKEFKKSEFFSILESDYGLMKSYYEYFLNEKTDLKVFQKFIQRNSLKFNKKQLERFIEKFNNTK